MKFQFDPAKAKSNLKKHGVSFADAEGVFYDPLVIHKKTLMLRVKTGGLRQAWEAPVRFSSLFTHFAAMKSGLSRFDRQHVVR